MFKDRNRRPGDLHFLLSPRQLTDFSQRLFHKTGMRWYRLGQYQKIFDSVLTVMRDMGYRIVKEEHLHDDRREADPPILG